ncbi:hypothetical protein RHGRI_020691 [Rhododendron griersonianum]|uniref:ABC transporter domain-containing protein n=1 Tax=Rhododendron griersonianum TaxID=479676 RepID=A0AAV6JPR1_9ERIC|nr:hypothetical protein RHGRI_020691 [Rhododendron griersonianum]
MDGGENVIRAISTRWSSSTIWRGNELFSFSSNEEQDEEALKWAALENLPTFARIRKGILSDEEGQIREIDVKNLGIIEKRNLVERLLEIAEEGNKNFLLKLKKRIDRVGINLPTIEVRFEHLNVDAEAYVGGRALPTVSNFFVNIFQALSLEGQKANVAIDYVLKILGLEVCADTMVGDQMLRGISGGQKKRVTTGEMLVGPARALFMDEISTGLDTSTTFHIVNSIKNSIHILQGTCVISLLQPAPETYDLFDDIILLSDGHIVYQGPREYVLEFFEHMGFKCPDRKGVADFLQEVTSRKEQEQYWDRRDEPYRFVTVTELVEAFTSFHVGRKLGDELAIPFDKAKSHPAALTTEKYGLDPNVGRFFKMYLLLLCINQMASGLFRLIAALGRNMIVANTFGTFALLAILVMGGFILSRDDIKKWLIWGYWALPLMYGQNAIAVNEFLGDSWRQVPPNSTESLGVLVLKARGIFPEAHWYWVGVGALVGYVFLFNVIFTLALAYLSPFEKPQAVLSKETLEERNVYKGGEVIELSLSGNSSSERGVELQRSVSKLMSSRVGRSSEVNQNRKRGMVLPFEPLSITFDDIKYAVDMPQEMRAQGIQEDRLQLLKGVSGAFRPGVLTALMGVSGAGKTTLMDTLAGRKTGGYIEGRISISGYPKKQETFARVAGYCEQTDIHSPHVTVYESLKYSAWLRLPPEVNSATRKSINGVCKIKDGYNPATWMLEVTSLAQEAALGVDFAHVYKNSELYRRNKNTIMELSTPLPGSKELYFTTQYSQSFFIQCMACLWKQHLSYWRNPPYTAVRFLFSTMVALLFGTIFWDIGSKRETQQDIFNAMGSMYIVVVFVGVQAAISVQPIVAVERAVFYRESAAGMYSALPYAFGQVVIELPYILVQTVTYGAIVYTMIGFEWKVAKFFWYLFFVYCTFVYYTYYGMMTVAVTPNLNIASIIASSFYAIWNLFSGFIIPKTRIPLWWRWYYYVCPVSWSLYGLVGSQYGDIQERLDTGETVEYFVVTYFDFRHDFVGYVALIMVGIVLLFGLIFAFSIKSFNFQKR